MRERTVQTDAVHDSKATETTRRRYQRNARFYDWMEGGMEKQHAVWREQLWRLVNGPKVLEVGVGTGKNIAYYPADLETTGIDLTPGMLECAKVRAQELKNRFSCVWVTYSAWIFQIRASTPLFLPLFFVPSRILYSGYMKYGAS